MYFSAYLEAGRTLSQTVGFPHTHNLALRHRTVAGAGTPGLSSATCLPTRNPKSLLAPAFTAAPARYLPTWPPEMGGASREEWEVRGPCFKGDRQKGGLLWGRGAPVSKRESGRVKPGCNL